MWLAFAVAVAVYLACAVAGLFAGGAAMRPQGGEWLILVAEGCGGAVEGLLRRACARWRRPVARAVVIGVAPADEVRAIVERLAPKMGYEVTFVEAADRAQAEREVAAIRLGSAPEVRISVIHIRGRVRAGAAP
ncbi:hypothetical protein [Alicyclobacillus sendaiensis]|uniref:hypothetical protein n=1 Tax=Alicyclobacillus sendaiensis TaxID=192387 RepID=UPI000780862E|nr:hypothetical protein [Alicyclobacillus sendaiensis]